MPTKVEVNSKALASSLAHNAAFDEMKADGTITDETEMFESNGIEYNADAQDIYNRHYDYFMESIFLHSN